MKTKFYVHFAGLCLATIGIGLGQPCSITITREPQSHGNCFGTPATLTVEAVGTAPLAYQWQQFGDQWVDVLEATNSMLLITNFQPTNVGYYQVIITNADCAVTSQVALLSVLLPPSISGTGQPTN